jgi:hypothetical protein
VDLLLSQRGDAVADWLAAGLRARGRAVEHVTADRLLGARRIEHRLGAAPPSFSVELADGPVLRSGELRRVWNRLTTVPDWPPGADTSQDGDYARQELFALWLSWLESVSCPVRNRPGPQGLSGVWLARLQWAVLARRAGLPVAEVELAPGAEDGDALAGALPGPLVLVAAGAVFGAPAAESLVGGCRALASAVGAELLELRFVADHDGWRFHSASTLPDLRRGGDALIDRLAMA